MIRDKKIKTIFLVCLAMLMALSCLCTSIISIKYACVYADIEFSSLDKEFDRNGQDKETYARAMAVIEAETGRVLYQKNKDEQLAMASTTKIMTALVTIKNCENLDEEIKVDNRAVGIEGTSLYLQKDEKKTIRELLYGLILPSGNDAAVALACHVGGSEEEFCKMMNEEACRLGAYNTNFVNAHGLDADGHHTTAYDLALITAEAMKQKDFVEIINTKEVKVSGNELVAGRSLRNKNRLLGEMEGCNGVKTGFTDNAGRCFVGSAKRDGMTLICVVLNCGPMFEEVERLLDMAFEEYKMYDLLKAYSPSQSIAVTNGVSEKVETFTQKQFRYPLTISEYAGIEYETTLPSVLDAPIEKEKIVGEIQIKLDNHLLFSEKIYTMEKVKSTKFFDRVEEILDYWNM